MGRSDKGGRRRGGEGVKEGTTERGKEREGKGGGERERNNRGVKDRLRKCARGQRRGSERGGENITCLAWKGRERYASKEPTGFLICELLK